MTSPVSAIEAIEKAMEGVKHSEWFMSPWHIEEDASSVRNQSDRSYICNASSDSFAAYIAACNPVAMREVLAFARRAEALQREADAMRAKAIANARERNAAEQLVSELINLRCVWTDPHNDELCRRARALLGGENAE